MSGARVLVTGAGGFIGRNVVPILIANGHEVHAVGRHPQAFAGLAGFHTVDLFDAAATRALLAQMRPTHLVHLAWNATPGVFWTTPDNLDWVAASLLLTRAFAEQGGTRAVFAGTCAEYDWDVPLLDEATTPLKPRTLYGTAKAALFTTLSAAAPKLGISMAWGRVFFLYGPGEAKGRLVPDVIDSLLAGEPALCSAGTQRRDFMHVEDVARAFVTVLESDVTGPVNIASGSCRPLSDIISRIGAELGRPDLIRLGARPMQPGEPPELCASVEILTGRAGFKPRYSLEEGLSALCAARRG